jgi:nucleoside-diphosphate-sugar epimerase
MLALVTGGTGFIGSHLCKLLTKEGHRVRVLLRTSSSTANLKDAIERVYGDLESNEGMAEALEGVHWVFHLAGALKGFREADLMRVNRDGTRRLVEACLTASRPPSRFVLVSSLAAAGPSPGGTTPLSEDAPAKPLTWYGKSKLEAERVVLESGLPSVIVRPPIVFGPGDRDVYSYFCMARRGLLPVPGRTERYYSLVFAPDLVDGILRCAEASLPSGEILHITGPEVVSWHELGISIATALGVKGHILPLPELAIRAAGRCADGIARLRGKPEIFSSQKVLEMLAPAWVAAHDKAQRLLGWTAATHLDEALAQTAHWYREHGWLT